MNPGREGESRGQKFRQDVKNTLENMQCRGGIGSYGRHFGRPRQVDHLRSGVQDQPSQHGITWSLLKIKKLAGHGGEGP